MTRLLISLLAAGLVTSCVKSPETKAEQLQVKPLSGKGPLVPDQRPELGALKMSGPLNYNYKIYGDPVAAPNQVFSDDHYMYLQLNKGQVPPIPVTRDGKVVEYEVKRGFMIVPKAESLVLRIGPRKAFVDEKSLDIIRYDPFKLGGKMAESEINIKVAPPDPLRDKKTEERGYPSLKKGVEEFYIPVRDILSGGLPESVATHEVSGSWRVCAYPSTSSFKAAIKLKLLLKNRGWSVDVDPGCKSSKTQILLERDS